jgi:hypothetical protein
MVHALISDEIGKSSVGAARIPLGCQQQCDDRGRHRHYSDQSGKDGTSDTRLRSIPVPKIEPDLIRRRMRVNSAGSIGQSCCGSIARSVAPGWRTAGQDRTGSRHHQLAQTRRADARANDETNQQQSINARPARRDLEGSVIPEMGRIEASFLAMVPLRLTVPR